jgi:hypothetical protein
MERGALLTLERAWELAVEWYHDRLRSDWRRKRKGEVQAMFARLGLTSRFWSLEEPE